MVLWFSWSPSLPTLLLTTLFSAVPFRGASTYLDVDSELHARKILPFPSSYLRRVSRGAGTRAGGEGTRPPTLFPSAATTAGNWLLPPTSAMRGSVSPFLFPTHPKNRAVDYPLHDGFSPHFSIVRNSMQACCLRHLRHLWVPQRVPVFLWECARQPPGPLKCCRRKTPGLTSI